MPTYLLEFSRDDLSENRTRFQEGPPVSGPSII
jgi:hypothetical protein